MTARTCRGCRRNPPARGVVWLSICSSAEGKQGYNTAGEWQKVNQEKGFAGSALLLDTDGTVGRQYGAKTTPHMYVVNPEGTLIYQGAIDDKPSTDQDDIPGAKNYVRAALAEAMAGQLRQPGPDQALRLRREVREVDPPTTTPARPDARASGLVLFRGRRDAAPRMTFQLKSREHLGHPTLKPRFNQQLFEVVAPRYHFITRALSLGRDPAWKRRLVDMLPGHRREALPRPGLWHGRPCPAVAGPVSTGAGDRPRPDPGHDRPRAHAPGAGNIEFVVGDMTATSWPDDSADVITGGYALRNAPSLERALYEVHRVLRPGEPPRSSSSPSPQIGPANGCPTSS